MGTRSKFGTWHTRLVDWSERDPGLAINRADRRLRASLQRRHLRATKPKPVVLR